MPLKITRGQASPEMRRAWDRLMEANQALDQYKRLRINRYSADLNRDAISAEYTQAAAAYAKAARIAGYVGSNGRTKVPHITNTKP